MKTLALFAFLVSSSAFAYSTLHFTCDKANLSVTYFEHGVAVAYIDSSKGSAEIWNTNYAVKYLSESDEYAFKFLVDTGLEFQELVCIEYKPAPVPSYPPYGGYGY